MQNNTNFLFLFLFFLLSFFFVTPFFAQEDSERDENKNDPTEMSSALKEVIEKNRSSTSQTRKNSNRSLNKKATSSQVKVKEPSLPNFQLKGKMTLKNKPGVAIIEFEKRYFLIEEGEKVTLSSKKEGKISFQVKRISKNKVELQFKNRKGSLVLR